MWKFTIRSLTANKIRFALTTLAVVLGVTFVVASFVTTDSLRATFDELSADVNAGKDAIVRGEIAFGDRAAGAPAVDAGLVDPIAALPEVDQVEGELFVNGTVSIDENGDPLESFGPPIAGVNWGDAIELNQYVLLDGARPSGPDQFALDRDSFDEYEYTLGQTYTVITPAYGPRPFTLVGVFQFGIEENVTAGARLVAFDTPTAQDVLGYPGEFNEIWVTFVDGTELESGLAAIDALLPDGTEVVSADVSAQEFAEVFDTFIDPLGIVLLVFAVVILFVSAFVINNTFSIVVGQRIRELGLLRAVGATGRQVRRSVLVESVIVGVVATIVGLGLGLLAALGIRSLFDALGFSLPQGPLPMRPRTVLVAAVLGIGFTVVSSYAPARRAARISPMAALGEATRNRQDTARRRTLIGAVLGVLGVGLFGWGLLGSFDSATPKLVMLGVGAAVVFVAVGVLSPLVARPVSMAIGRPLPLLFRTPGRLARLNAARSPRRTAATAVMLTIGLALMAVVAIVGSSIKSSFAARLDTSVQADFIFTDVSFSGFPPDLTERLDQLAELDTVLPFQEGGAQVGGGTKTVDATTLSSLDRLVDIDVVEGTTEGAGAGDVAIHRDVADDRGLDVGDSLTMTFQNGTSEDLRVVAVFDDNSLVANYVVDITTWDPNNDGGLYLFALARSADGVPNAAARAAVEAAIVDYPQVRFEDQSEFLDRQASTLDSILVIVNVFLGISLIVALVGIFNTLTLSVFERTRELGLLRAVGMRRREMKRMVRWEAVIVAAFGALIGLALGLVFGVAIAAAIPDNLIDRIDLPLGQLVVFLAIAVVCGLLGAVFPARRAGKLDVLEAIAAE